MNPTYPPRLTRRLSPDSRAQPSRHRSRGGTLLGVFIGLIIGLGMAAAVAFWLMRNNPAFQTQNVREPAKDAAKLAKAEAEKPRFDFYKILPGTEEAKVQPERKAPDRPDRNMAEQAKEKQSATKAAERSTEAPSPVAPPPQAARAPERVATAEPAAKAVRSGERFWLQAGSFAGEPEAENLKARLALAGWEATVQQGMMPDKAIRFRVRLGPYDNPDELGRMKSELGKRGFDAAVIKY